MTRREEDIPAVVLEGIDRFPEVVDGLRNRLMAVHGWVEGKDFPPQPQDFQALMLYGLIYLASSQGVRSHGPGTLNDQQVGYKRCFFRQAIHVARHVDAATPDKIKELIDRSMDAMHMPTRYEYAAAGEEVVLTVKDTGGSMFIRLKSAVEAAADLLAEIPDANASEEDRREWDMLARCFVIVIGKHTDSQRHGNRIERLLSIFLTIATQRDFVDLGILCCETGHATMLDDLEDSIQSLEIDMGLRAAIKPTGSYTDWKANRRNRIRKKRRV